MLTEIAALAVLALLVAELAMRLPLGAATRAIVSPNRRALAVLRSARISDHWKERAMLGYARRTLAATGAFAGWVLLLVGAALALGAPVALVLPGFAAFAASPIGLAAASIAACLHVAGRRPWADV
ncbi:hypothetical protein Ga0609869_003458 [Rhodovulum iodosum]|uniref:SdpI family protein n=1 Tax=Rhodovulum iodosum TaxID=68291 RepID=A0ABV3XZB2_9RHOB|nr:hypothetical protein [Rhodovulum robiginosum]